MCVEYSTNIFIGSLSSLIIHRLKKYKPIYKPTIYSILSRVISIAYSTSLTFIHHLSF